MKKNLKSVLCIVFLAETQNGKEGRKACRGA